MKQNYLLRAAIFGVLMALPYVTQAAVFTVTKTADTADGTCDVSDCSLREAVIASNTDNGVDNSDNDTISIPAGTYTFALSGSEDAAATGDLDITDTTGTLTMIGAGSSSTIINANDLDRVMHTLANTTSVISYLTLTNGTSAGSGAGIQALGATTLDHVTVSNNAMIDTAFGGGIRCDSNTLVITDSIVSGNSVPSPRLGGAMNANLCNITIARSTFSGNTGGGGGALALNLVGNSILIEDSTFSSNTATFSGGAIYLNDTGTPSTTITVKNSTFTANQAGTNGGAISIGLPVNLTNVTMTNNIANGHGGAMYVENNADADLKVAFSTIAGNAANNDSSGGDDGGGLYVAGASADVRLKAVILADNTASGGNGANCFASAGLTSSGYNLFENTTDCTVTTQLTDNVTSDISYVTSANLASNGGSVQTMNMAGAQVTDSVPSAACTDAADAPLSTDARGMSRPQNTNCDRGAYEKDQTNPTVTVTAGTDTVECATGTWTNAGATATDNFSTGLTASTSNTVSVSTLGTQTITYTSTADGDGNTGTNSRSVTVRDTVAPVVTITGEAAVTLTVGDTYVDAGATVTDACDSTVTVTTTNPVDTAIADTYTVTYSAQDASGNTAVVKERTVTVEDAVDTTPIVTTNGKWITVTVNGEEVTSKQIHKKVLASKYYKLKTSAFFPDYTTVVVLIAGKKTGKMIVYRLTDDGQLIRKSVATFPIQERTPARLTLKATAHRITASFGQGEERVSMHWKLKPNGELKEL